MQWRKVTGVGDEGKEYDNKYWKDMLYLHNVLLSPVRFIVC